MHEKSQRSKGQISSLLKSEKVNEKQSSEESSTAGIIWSSLAATITA
jgi:hypothetical protein